MTAKQKRLYYTVGTGIFCPVFFTALVSFVNWDLPPSIEEWSSVTRFLMLLCTGYAMLVVAMYPFFKDDPA